MTDNAVLEEARALLEQERQAVQDADERHPVLPSVRTNSLGAATILLERFFTNNGIKQLAYYRETWYSYYKQLWSQRSEDDIDHFLHHRLSLCRQRGTGDDVDDVQDFNTAQRNVAEIKYQCQQRSEA